MTGNKSTYVKKRIEELRNKLLDLGLRNKLIQFRHNAGHKTYVRIVDSSPDKIFNRLSKEEKEYTFRGLSVESTYEDEETEGFLRELENAKTKDEKYIKELIELEEEGDISQLRALRIERRLKDRVRGALGMEPISKSKIDPISFAQNQGINISYDLIKPKSTNRSERHLQTLYSDAELTQRLKKIEDMYNSSIQERGINTLYLAMGFLEWTEHENSDGIITSPLILLRLELEKKKSVGRNQEGKLEVCIKAESNETTYNSSLAAKLKKDFQYDLPKRKEDESPEVFFQRIEKSIPKSKDWKVRRYVTVCHLSFQKITLYEDLGADRWKEYPLQNQELLNKIISGNQSESSNSPRYLEDYDIDGLQDKELVDLLIRDADSSQHSALVDAIAGKNLVIEGPPGTGKSQTITNLIAACMHHRKSVLFVAEKLAALQVVKKRLDDCKCSTKYGNASLGDFCLELHSNKVRRSEVHKKMKTRLDLRGRVLKPRNYEESRKLIWEQRRKMKDFLDWLHTTVGSTGLTFFEIIWGESNAADILGELTTILDSIYIEKCDDKTPSERERLKEAAVEYARSYFAVKASSENLNFHPWLWVKNADLGKFDAEGLFDNVVESIQKIEKWKNFLYGLSATYHWPIFTKISDVQKIFDKLKSLSIPDIDLALLVYFSSPVYAESVEHEMVEIQRFRDGLNAQTLRIKDPNSLINWNELPRLIDEVKCESYLPSKTQFEVQTDIDTHRQKIQRIEIVSQKIEIFSQFLECRIEDMTLSEINLLREVCGKLIDFGEDLSSLLKSGFSQLSARSRWALFYEEWKIAKARADQCSGKLARLDGLDSREIRNNAAVLREANYFQKLFSKDVKNAKKLFRSIYIGTGKLKLDEQVDILLEAASVRELMESVEKNKNVVLLPDHLTCSTSSDLERLNRQLQHVWDIRLKLSQNAPFKKLWEKLASASSESQIELCSHFNNKFLTEALEIANTIWKSDQNIPISKLKSLEEEPLRTAESLMAYAEKIGLKSEQRFSDLREIVIELTDLLFIKNKLSHGKIANIIGSNFSATSSDLKIINVLLDYKRKVDLIEFEGEHRDKLYSLEARTWLIEARNKCVTIDQISKDFKENLEELYIKACGLPCNITPSNLMETDLVELRESLVNEVQYKAHLFDHLSFIYCTQAIQDLSANNILECIRDRATDINVFSAAIDYVLYRSILRDYQGKQKLRLSRNAIEGYQKLYCELDIKLQELTIQNIIFNQNFVSPPSGIREGPRAEWTELSLVELEANKERSHFPIRHYLSSAGKAVRELMPCMMMSPQTVAEFLEPKQGLFDIVIIDEASQLRPEEAISVLSRGKQLVVVGDDKQLPPSSFFMANEEITEGEDEEDNAESILEMAAVTFENVRRLRWHYRSRHDSLIHYSNQEFYDNHLVVFPSPIKSGDKMGIIHHYSNGLYNEGLNRIEGEHVVNLVVNLMHIYPTKSIGVATMNNKQKEYIFDEIGKISETNKNVALYISKWEDQLEYFFVKNLENVQGDERDIVVVSTVYGPSEGDKKVSQNFGPINKQYGHRRLNVLFTRAKEAIHVVTSLKPSDIRVDDEAKRGVRVFREYLQYAIDGFTSRYLDGIRNIPTNDFERSVGRVLKQKGYDIAYQVGSSGYYIDIGVKNSNGTNSFIMAVECDGAPFHSSKSARDRDRLRQEQLERLGWKFHRIWSTDWYRSRTNEESKLIDAIKKAEAEYASNLSDKRTNFIPGLLDDHT